MKLINLRLMLLFVFCGIAAVSVLWFPAAGDHVLALESDAEKSAEEETEQLGIGSPAPPLDIEHWIQDGNGFFSPVTDFQPGKVYVVEFWATWCPPCVASMPHLAELQNQFRGRDVQIISVSDEPLKTIESFLDRETDGPDGETTFREITAAYSLTTDPDGSTHEDYMEAANQSGIPTAFIVGKDAKIEWIGHPMEIDEPLEQVVKGNWDREEYAEQVLAKARFEKAFREVSRLANRGDFHEAMELIDAELEKKQPEEVRELLTGVRQQLKLMSGMIDDELKAHFEQRLESFRGDPIAVVRYGMSLYQAAEEHKGLDELMKQAAAALNEEVAAADQEIQPMLYDTLARLHKALGDLDAAIEAQEAAVEASSGRARDRLALFLKDLKAERGDAPEEPADDADKDE